MAWDDHIEKKKTLEGDGDRTLDVKSLADGRLITFVDRSGAPVGTGHWDASRGAVRVDGEETTVVYRVATDTTRASTGVAIPIVDGSTGDVVARGHLNPDGVVEYVEPETIYVDEQRPEAKDDDPWSDAGAVPGIPLADAVTSDAQHTWYRLPTPGGGANIVRLPDTKLWNPTNTSSCPCAVFIGSFDDAGNPVSFEGSDKVKLRPGETLPYYQAAPGSKYVGVSCSAGCTGDGCKCELRVSIPNA